MKQEIAQKILKETKECFDRIAKEFSIKRSHFWEIMKTFVSYLKEGDKILDVGCGNGRFYELLKNKNVSYIGIDNSVKLIEIARKKFPTLKPKPQFLVASVLDLPFKDERFDKVFMFAVLPHIPSQRLRQIVLKNIWQVLKKNGLLIITNWHLWQPKLLLRYHLWPIIFGWRKKNLDWKDVLIPWKMKNGQTVDRYYHAFTKRELKRLLTKTGFHILEIYYEKHGQKINFWQGNNLVAIAKKY